jgi:HAD superfamily hydrolase (TIGR01509 family)
MGHLKAVLFDMDGVLTDSEELIAEAGVRMFAQKGYVVTQDDFYPFRGYGENRFLGGVAEKYGIPFDQEKDKARTYEIYCSIVKGNLTPLPGSIEFVHRCRDLGFKTALVTSTDFIKMQANIDEIGLADGAFDVMINGLDVTRRKPYPDMYLLAARRLGVPPENCLVVEDAIAGVSSAVAAGCRCLALTSSYSRDELSAADWIIESLEDVPEEVLRW